MFYWFTKLSIIFSSRIINIIYLAYSFINIICPIKIISIYDFVYIVGCLFFIRWETAREGKG